MMVSWQKTTCVVSYFQSNLADTDCSSALSTFTQAFLRAPTLFTTVQKIIERYILEVPKSEGEGLTIRVGTICI